MRVHLMRARRIALTVAIVVVVLLIVAVGGVLVFTNTDWGRERTRRILVSIINGTLHGQLRVGSLGGNLLRGALLRQVSLTDSAGAPFMQADEIRMRYTILPLLHRHLYFDHVTLVHPRIILDRPPNGIWNFDRIIPRDTTHKGGPPGFGSWIRLTNVTLVDGYIRSQAPWAPAKGLTPRQRDSVITYATGPQGRQRLVRVPGGFQQISEFRDVNATLPLMQVADPKIPTQTIDVSSLRMVALPLRPPAVQVRDLRGRFYLLHDSLYFTGVNAQLSGSRLVGDGRYNMDNADLRLRLHANPVATNDLLWIDPAVPQGGVGALDFALDWVGQTSDYQATNASLRVAGASLAGKLGIRVAGDTLVYHNTDMRVVRLNTRTIAQLFPTLRSPRQGFLTGRAAVSGSMSRLRVNSDMAFDDPISGRSRIVATGTLGTSPGVFRADSLHVAVLPFQVGLAKVVMPTLPVGGVVTGNAVLNGSTKRGLAVQADVTHTDVTGPSHVVGNVVYRSGQTPWVNANVQLLPLSLATVGQFAPAAGLHGTVAGPVRITGPLGNMALDATLMTPDSGSIVARGTANLATTDKAYDLTVATHLFNANQVSTKAPPTRLTANAALHGHGVTPETVDARVTADIQTSMYDSLAIDSAMLRVRAANGMVQVDTLALRIPKAAATLYGDFGLTAAHTGSLRYVVAIDSLGTLSRFFPTDTGVVRPRPGILAGRLAQARADSIRIAQATAVQRAITGQAGPTLAVDTSGTIQRNALLGSVHTSGVLQGNVTRFNVDGTAQGKELVALGNSVNTVHARYIMHDVLTPGAYLGVGLSAKELSASGFALDSVVTQASYQQQRGTAAVTVWQETGRTYDAQGTFALTPTQRDIQLSALRLRFDSTLYTLARPTSIRIGQSYVDLDSFDVRGNRQDSRIFLDGRVPFSAPPNTPVNARFDVTNFDVANVAGLLESNVTVRGLVSLDAVLGGTAANPTIRGAFGTTRVTYNQTLLPEVHGTLAYADAALQTNTTANMEGKAPFLHAVGTVPINLALSNGTGPRLPTDRSIDMRIDADSFPLAHAPVVTDAITNLQGFATVHARVTGTVAHPDVAGQLALRDAGVRVVSTGTRLSGMNGDVRLVHDTIVVDSVVARSGGTIRLSGGIGVKTLANPTFALALVARDAQVLDGQHGNLIADASLNLTGQMNAPTARGTARLVRGIIVIPEPSDKQLVSTDDPSLYTIVDTTSAAQRLLFPPQSPLLKNLQANIAITIDRDVFVRSQSANVEIYTEDPILVTADLRQRQPLLIDGIVLSDRGEYRYQGRQFVVQSAAATFINTRRLDPTLQATALYTVQIPGSQPVIIQIVISGTLSAPKIALSSNANPPISQTDLLSYLAFGQSSSSLMQAEGSGLTTGGSGSGNIVGRAAAVLQQQVGSAALGALANNAAGQAARALGADVFDITPADVSVDVGNFLRATQIQFGKYIRSRTYLELQVRPDPAALQRPGFQLQQILDPRRGYSVTATLSPRYLLEEPSLSTDPTPITTSAFGLFLNRRWRY